MTTTELRSVLKTLKSKLVHRCSCPTKAEIRTAVFDYIEWVYNANAVIRASAVSYWTTRESANGLDA